MLKILHKGNQISLDIDPALMDLDVNAFQKNATVLSFVGGKVVGYDISTGVVGLADGAAAGDCDAVGFLINDLSGYFYENKPGLASGKVGVTFGNCVVITDQIAPGKTFQKGQKLYVGTGAEAGLITNVAPTGAREIGRALSDASASAPELEIAVLG